MKQILLSKKRFFLILTVLVFLAIFIFPKLATEARSVYDGGGGGCYCCGTRGDCSPSCGIYLDYCGSGYYAVCSPYCDELGCSPCALGDCYCVPGGICECSAGVCCDGCNHQPAGTICGYSDWHSCYNNCTLERTAYTCSGRSNVCGGGTLKKSYGGCGYNKHCPMAITFYQPNSIYQFLKPEIKFAYASPGISCVDGPCRNPGSWSSCYNADNVCAETGEKSRTIYGCVWKGGDEYGKCEADTETDYSCPRITENNSCGVTINAWCYKQVCTERARYSRDVTLIKSYGATTTDEVIGSEKGSVKIDGATITLNNKTYLIFGTQFTFENGGEIVMQGGTIIRAGEFHPDSLIPAHICFPTLDLGIIKGIAKYPEEEGLCPEDYYSPEM